MLIVSVIVSCLLNNHCEVKIISIIAEIIKYCDSRDKCTLSDCLLVLVFVRQLFLGSTVLFLSPPGILSSFARSCATV